MKTIKILLVNWAKRHLNWTLILYFPALFVLYITIYYTWKLFGVELGAGVGEFSAYLGIIGWLVLGGWVLKQKGRSLWWLALTFPFVYFATIIWCLLENHSQKLGE